MQSLRFDELFACLSVAPLSKAAIWRTIQAGSDYWMRKRCVHQPIG